MPAGRPLTLSRLLQEPYPGPGRESTNVEDRRSEALATPLMSDAQFAEYLKPYRKVPTVQERADYRLPPDQDTLGELSAIYMAPWLLRN